MQSINSDAQLEDYLTAETKIKLFNIHIDISITSESIAKFQQLIDLNKETLQYFSLFKSQIEDGAVLNLSECSKLENFSLYSTTISSKDLNKYLDSLPKSLESISLEDKSFSDNPSAINWAALSKLPNLRFLRLSSFPGSQEESLSMMQAIASLPNLSVSFTQSSVAKTLLKVANSNWKSLSFDSLNFAQVSEDEFESIYKFDSLESIDFGSNDMSHLTRKFVQYAFNAPKKLQRIWLNECQFDAQNFFEELKVQIKNSAFQCKFVYSTGYFTFQFPNKTICIESYCNNDNLERILGPTKSFYWNAHYAALSQHQSGPDSLSEELDQKIFNVVKALLNLSRFNIEIFDAANENSKMEMLSALP